MVVMVSIAAVALPSCTHRACVMSSVLTYCPSQLLSADTVTHDSMAWGDWLHQPGEASRTGRE